MHLLFRPGARKNPKCKEQSHKEIYNCIWRWSVVHWAYSLLRLYTNPSRNANIRAYYTKHRL